MKAKNNKKNIKMRTELVSAVDCFPKDENSKQVLRKRAEQIAKSLLDKSENIETENYICFALGLTEKYGIDYRYTKEVINSAAMTKLPCAEHFIAGIINRRGALIAVLDLKQLFFNKTTSSQENYNIIIVNSNNMTVGILADRIEGNNSYDPKSLSPALPSENLIKTEFILGLHQGKIAIINIEAIMADPALQIANTTVKE